MFTPNETEFTDEYNEWLASIPKRIWPIIFMIKRFYRADWGDDWRSHFGVDIINGHSGHELKYGDRSLVGSYLRVGSRTDGSWRTFKLRQDFIAADKVQMEDDITASIVLPAEQIPSVHPDYGSSVKILENCEFRLFQRPDDAIHRGYDKQAEADIAGDHVFWSNYAGLTTDEVQEEIDDFANYEKYTQVMKDRLVAGIDNGGYTGCQLSPPADLRRQANQEPTLPASTS